MKMVLIHHEEQPVKSLVQKEPEEESIDGVHQTT